MPELEAWEKVYIGGRNGTDFLESVHGQIDCIDCHTGGSASGSIEEIHDGMVQDPSAEGACDDCHEDIAAAMTNSLHANLWGEKRLIEQRCGCDFAPYEESYDSKCGTCHTTCGQCHISRPTSVGGGLIRNGGHKVRATPHITENCTACHGSRIAFDYFGEYEGNDPDVHRSRGYRCEYCHTAQEIHGDGMSSNASGHYEHRYEVATMPRCEDCHADVAGANDYHLEHWEGDSVEVRLQCQVCHSQPYKNCNRCHVDSDGFTIEPSFVTFKIGHNIWPDLRDYDYTVVRHAPVAQDTYEDWGLSLPGYNDQPTWKYASPHNVQRWTAQTTTTGECGTACHDQPGTDPIGFYLREADIMGEPDYDANVGVVVQEDELH